jgi:23S rRNA (cytidine1920-2'-O)/16S rRNA (cytidine1409-2'-O)-methyltransferase
VAPRRRLDSELVRRGLVDTREGARSEIEAGHVLVSGAVADKPARLVASGEPLRLLGPPPRFVGRGGEKLDGALAGFGIVVTGRWLDAGASTGGFTDCLLQRGAAEVVAVDVGHGQLHERLRADPRVEVHERLNVRLLAPGDLGPAVDGVVADLSFISLGLVLPNLVGLARPGADLVLLVKPQFEAGRAEVSRGRGVVRDPEVWGRALAAVGAAAGSAGAAMMGAMTSPITGADGNVEFFLHCRAGGPDARDGGALDASALVATAVEEALERHGGR